MAGGYIGKLLFVNLTTGTIKEETPEEKLYRDFIGGYGVGARILYSRQKGGRRPAGTGEHAGHHDRPAHRHAGPFRVPLRGGGQIAADGRVGGR